MTPDDGCFYREQEPAKSWEREQEEYLLSKRDSEDMAAVCFGAIAVMVVLALALEAVQRLAAWWSS